jgi:hypothetical protein
VCASGLLTTNGKKFKGRRWPASQDELFPLPNGPRPSPAPTYFHTEPDPRPGYGLKLSKCLNNLYEARKQLTVSACEHGECGIKGRQVGVARKFAHRSRGFLHAKRPPVDSTAGDEFYGCGSPQQSRCENRRDGWILTVARSALPRASLGLRPLAYSASIVVILGLSKATSHIKSG